MGLFDRFRGPGALKVGSEGVLEGTHPYRVAGALTYKNDEGDTWRELILRLATGGAMWLELDEERLTLHKRLRAKCAVGPPATVDGAALEREVERGVMRLVHSEGDLPPRESAESFTYVDGRLQDGRWVSLEDGPDGVVAYESVGVQVKRGGELLLTDPRATARFLASGGE